MGDAFFSIYVASKFAHEKRRDKKCQSEIAWKQKDALLEEMMENKKGAVFAPFVLANLFVGCGVLWVAIHK